MRFIRIRPWVWLGIVAGLICAVSAYAATVGLPPGVQVNNDTASGIDPAQSAGLTDLTAGSLAGAGRVPWAAFSQNSGSSRQIFVRAFKGGAWHTEGSPASLNEDPNKVANAPSIDFTGANRSVPWATWVEPSTAFGLQPQVFASRFAFTPGAPNDGVWAHEGQANPGTPPSLNINTTQESDAPSLVGGAATAGANPVPWITWQEADNGNTPAPAGDPGPNVVPNNSTFQIFVERAVAVATGSCNKPARGTSVGKFCFQQVGIDRVKNPSLTPNTDPSLNVDPTRDGIQADIAFTGANDTVPWVVWYENSDNGKVTNGLLDADMVFAARGIADPSADGGFHWQVVGLGTAGKTAADDILDTSHGGAGECASSQAAEQACSLNANPAAGLTDGNGAENPSIAAGTMVAGNPTVPWIAWDESSSNGGPHSVFVARLVGGDHYVLLNNGQPISHTGVEATRPDIVFSHNTPYVSWHETQGSTTSTFVGHFDGPAANPVFHIDTAAIPTTTPGPNTDDDLTDVRQPVASTCPADPFTQDGAACPGNTVGTPFFALTNTAGGPRALFANTYQPENVQTAAATGVGVGQATLAGSVNPAGAPAQVDIEFGPTTSYGQTTPTQLLLPSETQTPFVAAVSGLPAGTLHYRAVVTSDFGTFDGPDTTVAIPSAVGTASAGRAHVKGTTARVTVSCHGVAGQSCQLSLRLTVTEKLRGRRVIAITARKRTRKVTVTVGRASVTLSAGQSKVVSVSLNRTGKRLLAKYRHLTATLRITQSLGANRTRTVSHQVVRFKAHKKHHKH